MATSSSQCETCNKSTLSLALFRPSPIAKADPLVPQGTNAVASDMGLMAGVLPARLPTESRFVLRFLRAGYVHVYLPSPPPGVKNWLVYRVTEHADLYPEGSGLFKKPPMDEVCSMNGHNATGIKLLHLPQAHKITQLWIAYSANLWSETLKEKNKADPAVMQLVSLQGGGPNTFKPTAESLKSKVLECALSTLNVDGSKEHDYPFHGIGPDGAQAMADNLIKAAGCHPQTKGKELAVVLRDPVGIVTELNALRLRRNELVKREIQAERAKPENAHPLVSSELLLSLKQAYADIYLGKALEKHAPLVSYREYTRPQPTPLNPMGQTVAPFRYRGGTWEELPSLRGSTRIDDSTLGRVWYPNSAERAIAEGQKEAQEEWEDIEDEFDEPARKAWVKAFDERMKREHLDKLEPFEIDWWTARQDAKFNTSFERHFDENETNAPLSFHCPGLVYAEEVHWATTPAPCTSGRVLEEYLKDLAADPTQPHAVMLRSLVANQGAMLKLVKDVMWLEKAVVHAHENRNDKLYDLGAALVLKAADGVKPRYRWMTVTAGNVLGGYALGVVQAFGATVGAATAVGSTLPLALYGARLAGASLVQRTTDLALQSITNKTGLVTPLVLTKKYPAGRGLFLLTRGGHFSRAEAKGFIRNGEIEIALHTDTAEMAKVQGDMDRLLLEGPDAGRVKVPGKQAALLTSPAALGALELSEAKFSELFARNGTKWDDLFKKAKAAFLEMDKKTGRSSAVMLSLEGRLAWGVILINGVAGLKSLDQLKDKSLSDQARLEVRLALTDAVCSVLGAGLQLVEVVRKQRIASRIGVQVGDKATQQALEKVTSIHAMRATGFMLGGVAGMMNAWGQWLKAGKAADEGHNKVAAAYYVSWLGFAGTVGVFGIQLAGSMASAILASTVRNGFIRAVASGIARRYGAAAVGTMLGASLEGWGLILLVGAVGFETLAIVLTPSEAETWASRTKFGKAWVKKYANAEEELKALLNLFPPAESTNKPKESVPLPYARAAGAPGT